MKSVLITKSVAIVNRLGLTTGSQRVPHCTAEFPDSATDAEISAAVSELPVSDPQFQILPSIRFVTASRTVLVPEDVAKSMKN